MGGGKDGKELGRRRKESAIDSAAAIAALLDVTLHVGVCVCQG